MPGSEQAEPAPRTIAGREVRERELRVGGVRVRYFEVRDVDALLEAAIEQGERPPYGAVPWASGVAVAELLATRDLAGTTVVDVGAGTGVTSLAAAALGARVVAVDVDPLSRVLIAEAAKEQGLEVETRALDLEGDEPLPAGELVIFADLLYEGALAEATARRFLEVVRRGDEAIVADPGRGGRDTFLLCLLEAGVEATFETVKARLPGEVRSNDVGILRAGGAR